MQSARKQFNLQNLPPGVSAPRAGPEGFFLIAADYNRGDFTMSWRENFALFSKLRKNRTAGGNRQFDRL
jgi:hypothetical protein